MATLLSGFIKLNSAYQLIGNGDRLLLAVSGGIDSLCMAAVLHEYRRMGACPFELQAAYVRIPEVALADDQIEQLRSVLNKWEIPLAVIEGRVPSKSRFRCYACAKERRKQLCIYCDSEEFDALACGHHLDDYLETGLLNLVYGGHLESLCPKQTMFDGAITVIRPLLRHPKKHIRAYAQTAGLDGIKAHCPFEADNQREKIRQLIRELSTLNRAFRKNLCNALDRWNHIVV